ncbi:MAG TPA: hypothetical protein VHZ03_19725 [Trebonia sp.]|jgi:hypothetical protein|nr:hypothetical protein [Trebonia sp.]
MHPELAREMIRQRAGERQGRAAKAGAARAARDAARDRRDQAAAAAAIPLPRIPDYVDGTFRETGDAAHAR